MNVVSARKFCNLRKPPDGDALAAISWIILLVIWSRTLGGFTQQFVGLLHIYVQNKSPIVKGASAKFWDFLTPPPLLVTVTNQPILFLLSAFGRPPHPLRTSPPPTADVIYGSPQTTLAMSFRWNRIDWIVSWHHNEIVILWRKNLKKETKYQILPSGKNNYIMHFMISRNHSIKTRIRDLNSGDLVSMGKVDQLIRWPLVLLCNNQSGRDTYTKQILCFIWTLIIYHKWKV